MFDSLFFKIKITWKKVIISAIVAGVITALMLIIPFFNNTSLVNIGVGFESWILFAVIIIMNCDTPLEACLKTFVFFLISQPLVYLLQVPFNQLGWGIFQFYPRWFIWTIATLPGAYIAWLVKKDNVLSALILTVATAFLAYLGVYYLDSCLRFFPRNLLSTIFCFVQALLLIFVLLKNNRNRIITLVITLAVTMVFTWTYFFNNDPRGIITDEYSLPKEGVWTIEKIEGDIGDIYLYDDYYVEITAKKFGEAVVTITNNKYEPIILNINYEKPDILRIVEE